MNSEWLGKNKRALIGIAILALLLSLNFILRARRAKPAAVAVVAPAAAPQQAASPTPGVTPAPAAIPVPGIPATPDPTQPISSLLAGISNKLTDMETRLATIPLPITRVILHESLASPGRDLFHWPGSTIVVPPPVTATGTAPVAPTATAPASIVYLGSVIRGNRKFALVRIDSRAFMIEGGALLPATEYLVKEIASRSIDLEAADGKNRSIQLNASHPGKIDEIVKLLKDKPDRSRMEIRWFPTERTASGTASPTAGTAGLTSTAVPR